MPYVNVRITREGATADQKARIIAGVTDLLVEVLGKNPATTVVVIDEVAMEDWGIGGMPVEAYRRRKAAGPSGAGGQVGAAPTERPCQARVRSRRIDGRTG